MVESGNFLNRGVRVTTCWGSQVTFLCFLASPPVWSSVGAGGFPWSPLTWWVLAPFFEWMQRHCLSCSIGHQLNLYWILRHLVFRRWSLWALSCTPLTFYTDAYIVACLHPAQSLQQTSATTLAPGEVCRRKAEASSGANDTWCYFSENCANATDQVALTNSWSKCTSG